MKSGTLRRAFATILVYIVIFIGLVLLQFSAPSGFVWKSGRASVSATATRAQPDRPDKVRIAFGGLAFVISNEHPASLFGKNGSSSKLLVKAVEHDGEGVKITFSETLLLLVSANAANGNDIFSLHVVGSDVAEKSIKLPYELGFGTRFGDPAQSTILEVAGGSYSLSLPRSAFGQGYVLLGQDASSLVVRSLASTPAIQPLIAKSDVDFRQVSLAWMDKVWAGLSATRFDAEAMTWRGADSSQEFSEKALVAFIAEALRRGQAEQILARMKGVREKHGSLLGFLSVPYFGDTAALLGRREAADIVEARRLAGLIQNHDPAILESPDLVLRVVDRSPVGFYQEVIRFVSGLAPADLTLRQCIGLVDAAVDAGTYIRGSVDPLPNHLVAEDRLVAQITKTDAGFFLPLSADGSVDISLSLDAGLALIALGKSEAKDNLVALGQGLVEGILSLSNQEGFLPSKLVVKDAAIVERSGSLAPELIYPRVSNNPFYPHETSFAKDVEPGVWAWTAAPTLTVEGSANRRVFSATWPVGLAHYMALYGVRGFSNIKLYGIDYSPDSQFESYNVSGFLYKAASSVLYLKMRHKVEVERVELVF